MTSERLVALLRRIRRRAAHASGGSMRPAAAQADSVGPLILSPGSFTCPRCGWTVEGPDIILMQLSAEHRCPVPHGPKWCLCKECEATEITMWGDFAKGRDAVWLCLCCCGQRIKYLSERGCSNYRGP